ncbi:hypothetical protein AT6N2_C1174 [Agrobacterium tumefaciens]|nr:hypothetical protein AT6N2_C1174 [Agrobacterium tumefaciens]
MHNVTEWQNDGKRQLRDELFGTRKAAFARLSAKLARSDDNGAEQEVVNKA